jgi:hypothetical protein
MAGICLPGVQPVRLRPSGGRARYALALGFLMSLLAVAVYTRLDAAACGLCSVCAALSSPLTFVRLRQRVCDAGRGLGMCRHARRGHASALGRACCRDWSYRFF